jgi:hypothetical protein
LIAGSAFSLFATAAGVGSSALLRFLLGAGFEAEQFMLH